MNRLTTVTALAAIGGIALASLGACGLFNEPMLNSSHLSGSVTTESREATDFTGVELRGTGDVTIVTGDAFSVEVTADSALHDYISTSVRSDRLIIAQQFTWIGDVPDITYVVTMPEVTSLTTAGSGSITADNIDTPQLSVSVAGSGDVQLRGNANNADVTIAGSGHADLSLLRVADGSVDVAGSGSTQIAVSQSLAIDIAGSGDVQATGRADDLRIDVAGSGTFRGQDLNAASATISIAGRGDIEVRARDELTVDIVGSGDVVYFGDPDLNVSRVGSGKVTPADQADA